MKLLFAAILSATVFLTGGCAQDGPTAEEVGEHFQRGVSGEGELGPIDRQDDPFVNSREGDANAGHP